jgi:hypothetical protein
VFEGVDIPAQHGPPRAGDVRDSQADTRAAVVELGYQARFSFAQGMRKTLEWLSHGQPLGGSLSLSHMLQDLRYAFRMMARSRVFTAMAVLSLALGIGANTAIDSFMDAILMRSLPVDRPERLVVVRWHAKDHPEVARSLNGSMYRDPAIGTNSGNLPFRAYEALGENNPVLSHLFGFRQCRRAQSDDPGIGRSGEKEQFVSGGFFSSPRRSASGGPDDRRER